jgi:hypothetical protein
MLRCGPGLNWRRATTSRVARCDARGHARTPTEPARHFVKPPKPCHARTSAIGAFYWTMRTRKRTRCAQKRGYTLTPATANDPQSATNQYQAERFSVRAPDSSACRRASRCATPAVRHVVTRLCIISDCGGFFSYTAAPHCYTAIHSDRWQAAGRNGRHRFGTRDWCVIPHRAASRLPNR